MIAPTALDLYFWELLALYPNQFLSSNSVPNIFGLGQVTTLLLTGGLFVYVLVMVPILSFIYIRDLRAKVLGMFGVEIIVLYALFWGIHLGNSGYLSAEASAIWVDIPTFVIIGSALILEEIAPSKPLPIKDLSSEASVSEAKS